MRNTQATLSDSAALVRLAARLCVDGEGLVQGDLLRQDPTPVFSH